ncbi:hypothetical protein BGZ83_003929 [Gryganskiella cystojenkinii]|nr:hypothetical protein BGZ83_003929 [Gryganskiella cystojenkinii]
MCGICTSRECTIVAADILRDMKPGVDPCTDFFTFNCGGFMDRVSIPDDKAQIGYFNLEVIKAILSPPENAEDTSKGKDDASKRNLIKLQSLYGSCMDEKTISEVGVKPLADLVQKLIKVFPASQSVLANDDSDTSTDTQTTTTTMPNTPTSLEEKMNTLKWLNERLKQALIMRLEQVETEKKGQEQLRPATGERTSQTPMHVPVTDEVKDLQHPHEDKDERPAAPADTLLGDEHDEDSKVKTQTLLVQAEREQLALAIAQLAQLEVTTMVDFDVDSDPKNPDMNVFRFSEDGLGLPSKEYYTEEKIVAIYQTTVEEMFAIVLGKGKDKDNDGSLDTDTILKPTLWAEVAKNVVDFEKLLAEITSKREDQDNSELTYNPRTLAQVTELIPAVDWSLVIEKLFGPGTVVPDPIIVSSPDYLEKLNALLKDTPVLTLQNYFAWRLIHKLSGNLGIEYRKPMQNLRAALQGVSADLVTPRWETCVDVVDKNLGAMAGHYFIDKAFKGDSKEMADGIITSLRTSFLKGLGHLDWLDKETLLNATEKVNLLIQKIGYSIESPDVRSSESLEDYFKDLGVDKADFFGNQIRARVWTVQRSMADLWKPVDKAKWLMSPQTVNAYYNPSVNEIVFPAGILQPPFFHVDNPEYLNYGGVGVVAGHELTHAFDNEGRLFDARGKLSDWWSNKTQEEFKIKSQCFIDQYGNFTVKDPQGRENHVNGKLTLGENLADNGGLKKSFEAWQARFKMDPNGNMYKNHLLAGLEDYTREQLYYMGFARVWCSNRRPASAIESLRTDPHAPAKWRVNGAVQNSKHFAEVFKCEPRTGMNPDSKCDLW